MPSDGQAVGGNLKTVLERASDDLAHAQLPLVVNWAFGPLRDFVLVPAVNTTAAVLPVIPVVDDISAMVLDTTFNVVRFGYSHLPSTSEDGFREEVRHEAAAELAQFSEKRAKQAVVQHVPRSVVSLLYAATGFAVNTTVDLLTGRGRETVDLTMTTLQLLGYLRYTGIGSKHIADTVFRRGAISDFRILAKVQGDDDSNNKANRRQRQKTAIYGVADFPFDEACWFMRYATAAYGMAMLESAEKLVTSVPLVPQSSTDALFGSWDKTNQAKICRYVNIPPQDIKYMTHHSDVGLGSTEVLRHFVAVDRKVKAVVLAIRGMSYSASGMVDDLDASVVPFCGGFAHKGISEMAMAILDNEPTMTAIRRALVENADYELVITGHSLGAGAACLVNIKGHYDGLFGAGTTKVRCFGYASPPVYAALDVVGQVSASNKNQSVRMAIQNTTCYIHQDDWVPFISTDAVIRLNDTMDRLHIEDQKLGWWARRKLIKGAMKPTPEMMEIVDNGVTVSRAKGDQKQLFLPAKRVLWMYKDDDSPTGYYFQYCSPAKLADLNIFVSPTMMTDHFPSSYEEALHATYQLTLQR